VPHEEILALKLTLPICYGPAIAASLGGMAKNRLVELLDDKLL